MYTALNMDKLTTVYRSWYCTYKFYCIVLKREWVKKVFELLHMCPQTHIHIKNKKNIVCFDELWWTMLVGFVSCLYVLNETIFFLNLPFKFRKVNKFIYYSIGATFLVNCHMFSSCSDLLYMGQLYLGLCIFCHWWYPLQHSSAGFILLSTMWVEVL